MPNSDAMSRNLAGTARWERQNGICCYNNGLLFTNSRRNMNTGVKGPFSGLIRRILCEIGPGQNSPEIQARDSLIDAFVSA